MVEKWKKQLLKLDKNWELKNIIKDIINNKFDKYDFKKLTWHKNIFRIRKGKIRIFFKIENWKSLLLRIESRWDVYKNL